MMIVKLVVALLLVPIIFVSSKHSLHVLQQQYYKLKRLHVVFFQQLSRRKHYVLLCFSLVFTHLLLYIVIPDSFYLIFILIGIEGISFFLYQKEQTIIIPLSLTPRIKRLIVALVMEWALVFIGIGFLGDKASELVMVFLFGAVSLWFPLFLWIPLAVLSPIEHLIRRHYVCLAKQKIATWKPQIIAITGSYGKTSFKHFLFQLLSAKFNVFVTPKSYNTLLGITKSINEQLLPMHNVAILEVGVDSLGGMDDILELFRPDITIITGIGPQHLATFRSLDNIVNEKMKLARIVPENGMVFLCADSPQLMQHKDQLRASITTYGYASAPIHIEESNYDGMKTNLKIVLQDGKIIAGVTTLLGNHMIQNLAGAIGVSYALGVSKEMIEALLPQIRSEAHRLERKQEGKWIILDDAYNSNLVGFRRALDVLKQSTLHRVLITPGVIELGSSWVQENKMLGQYAAGCIDELILVSKESAYPFVEGLKQGGQIPYQIVSSFKEAYQSLKQRYGDQAIVILMENDLPDNYIR